MYMGLCIKVKLRRKNSKISKIYTYTNARYTNIYIRNKKMVLFLLVTCINKTALSETYG